MEQHRTAIDFVCIDYSPVRSLAAQELASLHEHTLCAAACVAFDERGAVCNYDSLEVPWAPDGEGAAAVLPPEDKTVVLPIWALQPIVARLRFTADNKASKRLAAALATAFGTERRDAEPWHAPEDRQKASGGKRRN